MPASLAWRYCFFHIEVSQKTWVPQNGWYYNGTSYSVWICLGWFGDTPHSRGNLWFTSLKWGRRGVNPAVSNLVRRMRSVGISQDLLAAPWQITPGCRRIVPGLLLPFTCYLLIYVCWTWSMACLEFFCSRIWDFFSWRMDQVEWIRNRSLLMSTPRFRFACGFS